MTGGIIQLIAQGKQDHNLVGNPQISFFKKVYRKYTNFTMETTRIDSSGGEISNLVDTVITTTVRKSGDLLKQVYFNFEIPDIYSGTDEMYAPSEFKWIEHLGLNILKNTKLTIGSNQVDNLDSAIMYNLSELQLDESQKSEFNKMIGHEPEIYDPDLYNGEYFPVPYLDPDNTLLNIPSFEGNLSEFPLNIIYNVYQSPLSGQTVFQSTVDIDVDGTDYVGGLVLHADENPFNYADNPDYQHAVFENMYIVLGEEENGFCGTGSVAVSTTTAITLSAQESGTDDYYLGMTLEIGFESRIITDYNGTTKVATVSPAFSSAPGKGTTFKIIPHKRRINSYTSSTKTALFDPLNVASTDFVASVPYNIFVSKGSGMKVSIETKQLPFSKPGDNVKTGRFLTGLKIVEPGYGYLQNEKVYIDLVKKLTSDPPVILDFYILYSKYPHTRNVEINNIQNYKYRTEENHSTIERNIDFINSIHNKIPSIKGRKIRVPYNFYFSRNIGSAIPLVSLEYEQVIIETTLRKIKELYTINRIIKFNDFRNQIVRVKPEAETNITNFIKETEFNINYYLEATYIYLDAEEKRRFKEKNHEYLITSVQINNTSKGDIEGDEPNASGIEFNGCVRELLFIIQRNDNLLSNRFNNYSNWYSEKHPPYSYEYLRYQIKGSYVVDNEINSWASAQDFYQDTFFNNNLVTKPKSLDGDVSIATTDTERLFEMKYFRENILNKLSFNYNNTVDEREAPKNFKFYNYQIPYEYFKTNPKLGINAYSFSLNPNNYQPSGCSNMGMVQDFRINFNLGTKEGSLEIPQITGDEEKYIYEVKVYAVSYNVLSIGNGISNKVYNH